MNNQLTNRFYIPCNDIFEEVIHQLGGFTYTAKKINECNRGKPITSNMIRAWVECGKIPYKYSRILEAFARENKELFLLAFEYEGYVENKKSRKKYARSDFAEYMQLFKTPIPLKRVTWVGQFKKPVELERWLSIQGGVKNIVKNMNIVKPVSPEPFPESNFSYRTIYNYFYYGYMPTVWRNYFENQLGMPKNVGFDKKESLGDTKEDQPTEEVKELVSGKDFEGDPSDYEGERPARCKRTVFLETTNYTPTENENTVEETFSILD